MQYEEVLYWMVCTVSQILVPILRLFIGHNGFICVVAFLDRNHLSLLHQKGVNLPGPSHLLVASVLCKYQGTFVSCLLLHHARPLRSPLLVGPLAPQREQWPKWWKSWWWTCSSFVVIQYCKISGLFPVRFTSASHKWMKQPNSTLWRPLVRCGLLLWAYGEKVHFNANKASYHSKRSGRWRVPSGCLLFWWCYICRL